MRHGAMIEGEGRSPTRRHASARAARLLEDGHLMYRRQLASQGQPGKTRSDNCDFHIHPLRAASLTYAKNCAGKGPYGLASDGLLVALTCADADNGFKVGNKHLTVTNRARIGGSGNRLDDAVDFVGWYAGVIGRATGIAPDDPFHLYLAYHEGHGGYKRGSYRKKKSLQRVANKVASNASNYGAQLKRCESRFRCRRFWQIWPFCR